MEESLKVTTAVNLGYNVVCKLLVISLSALTLIILARNLSPDDFGIVGFAMIFIQFLRQFSDIGITASIVRKESIGDSDLYTVFTLKMLLAGFLFAISFAWGSLVQKAFHTPGLKAVIVVLCVDFLIDCLKMLPTTMLMRELKFKRLIIPQLGSQLVATVVALAAVYAGFGYWSIVFSSLAASASFTLLAHAVRPVALKWRFDLNAAKEHLKFGRHLLFAGILIFFLFNADNFLVGSVRGAASLGFYALAFDWSTKPAGFIGGAIHDILLSTFCRVQQDRERLERGYTATVEYVGFAAVLAYGLLFVLSKELLTLVLGGGTGKWLPALLALKILCIYGAIRTLLEPVASVIVAIGKPALIAKSNGVVAGLEVLCLYPALAWWGIDGVALVVTLSYAVQFLIYFPVMKRELAIHPLTVLRSLLPAIYSGGVLTVFAVAVDRFIDISWCSLMVKATLGSGLYLLAYGCMTKWKILKDARQFFGAAGLKPGRLRTGGAALCASKEAPVAFPATEINGQTFDYSVAIRSVGDSRFLRKTLASIAGQTVLPAEIVIAVPHDTGPWPAMENVRFTAAERGMVTQRKSGILAAKCRFVLLLDDDVVLHPRAAKTLLRTMVSHGAHCVVPFWREAMPREGLTGALLAFWGIAVPSNRPGIRYTPGGGYYYPRKEPRGAPFKTYGGTGAMILLDRDFVIQKGALGDCEFQKIGPYALREDGAFIFDIVKKGGVALMAAGAGFEHLGGTTRIAAERLSFEYKAHVFNQYLFWKKFILPSWAGSAVGTAKARILFSWYMAGVVFLGCLAAFRHRTAQPLAGILAGGRMICRMEEPISSRGYEPALWAGDAKKGAS